MMLVCFLNCSDFTNCCGFSVVGFEQVNADRVQTDVAGILNRKGRYIYDVRTEKAEEGLEICQVFSGSIAFKR